MSALLVGAITTLVFCAPGYPGAAQDAQPLVDAFATAATAAARWPAASLTAVYDPTEESGLTRLTNPDAALAFVPFPFFVKYAATLRLTPLAQADVTGVGVQQRWTLVAKSTRVTGPGSLTGYTILSTAGYAPTFVRGFALSAWALPTDVKISPTMQVLSALHRVATGRSAERATGCSSVANGRVARAVVSV